MAQTAVPLQPGPHRAWTHWTHLLVDLLPIPFPVVVGFAGLLMVIEQLVEQSLTIEGFDDMTPRILLSRAVIPLVMMYMLFVLKLVKSRTVLYLFHLRPAVKIDDGDYDQSVRDMVRIGYRVELALLLTSLLIVLLIFVVEGFAPATVYTDFAPPSNAATLLILLAYTLFGWVGLLLLYASLKHAWALARLARQPLFINILDPSSMLPFGELSLLHSFAVAGVIIIMLIGLGRPTSASGFLVLVLVTLATLLSLLLPLWGVHEQMDIARDEGLRNICDQLADVNAHLLASRTLETTQLTELSTRAAKLDQLRSLVLKTPTWPFRNGVATLRAVLAPTSPLIYFFLIEILRNYILPYFS